MRRSLLALALLAAVAALPATASAKYQIGISDQFATTFYDPLYAPLKLSLARYITPWDVMSSPPDAAKLSAWITAARSAGQRIMVAFEASHVRGRERVVPSRAAYTRAIRAFRRAYPFVNDIQPWNEVNRCQRRLPDGSWLGQPICRRPRMAAVYYMAARRVFRGAKVTGLDVLDGPKVGPTVRYVKQFLRYARPRPRIWGFHNYSDTNRFSTQRTRALLKVTRSGEVWLTETGGIVKFGRSFPHDERRAAKALGCMFTIARKFRRVTRLYVYQFNGAGDAVQFDAGLITTATNTPRPGYAVVKARRAGPCRR